MLLKEIYDLNKIILIYRSDMYKLAKIKGLSDPDVIKISQKLDLKILRYQKILSKIHSSAKGDVNIQDSKPA
jgi:Spo0E like sporulation regulatory protein